MRVSVCVPHFRQEQYLKAAVKSALSQASALDEVEVVVCDNASGGGTPQVLDELEALGPEVKVLRNSYNIGMVANFNRTIMGSSGEVVCLLSADDELLPGAVTKVCDEFRADDSLALAYGSMRVSENGAPPMAWPPEFGPTQKFEPPAFAKFNLGKPETPLLSAFFKRTAFETVGGFKGEAGPVTDWLLWTELGLVGAVLRIHEPLGLYRVHGSNETLSAKDSYRWILYHYLAESYSRGLGCVTTQEEADRQASYARKSSLGTVFDSLRRGQRSLGRMQLLLTYCLWPSFRALGEVLAGTALSLLPRSAIESSYRWLKSRERIDKEMRP